MKATLPIMKSLLAPIAYLALLPTALAANDTSSLIHLDVSLQPTGNTELEATVNNYNTKEIRTLRYNLLSDGPNHKINVFAENEDGEYERLPYKGITYQVDTSRLTDKSFYVLQPSNSAWGVTNIAYLYDVSRGGNYKVIMSGEIEIADESNNLIGSIPYTSNELSLSVDGFAAAARHAAHTESRKKPKDCPKKKSATIAKAMKHCVHVALAAETAALNSTVWEWEEHFKGFNASTQTRQAVADVFADVAAECQNYPNNAFSHTCEDIESACRDDATLSYYLSWEKKLVFCNGFFKTPKKSKKSPQRKKCTDPEDEEYNIDQVANLIHQMAFVGKVTAEGIDYEYKLDTYAKQARDRMIENKLYDTYKRFVKDVDPNCSIEEDKKKKKKNKGSE